MFYCVKNSKTLLFYLTQKEEECFIAQKNRRPCYSILHKKKKKSFIVQKIPMEYLKTSSEE